MPWVEAMLRGQRILANADAAGALVSDGGGRVEIRYKPNDGRAYRAAASNIVVSSGAKLHPDETCAPAQAKPPRRTATKTATHGHEVPRGAWVAYTDGACSGNPGPAGSGVVIVSPDGKIHEGLEYIGEATNNVAELTGILRALEWVPVEASPILIHTDSQYAIGVLQKGWKAKANHDLVARTRQVLQARAARLVYVPGHQGVLLNERADELAREAVETRAARRPAVK